MNDTVEEFYKRDCPPEKKCTCKPEKDQQSPCSFYKEKLVMDLDQKLELLKHFGYVFPEYPLKRQEAEDFIEQYPVFILKKGTTLCHSTKVENILDMNETGTFVTTQTLGWWNIYLVGHSEYRGGWFTYETDYGGPNFGMLLNYRVLRDTPVLFVPRQVAGDYDTYSGSHLVKGVKDWDKKGYPEIKPEYYADEFAERLSELGFPGYISCDECEVFITHDTMRKSMNERPYKMIYQDSSPMELDKERTIYHLMVEALCEKKDNCPLQVLEGKRGETTIQVLGTSKIEKIMPSSEFRKTYYDTHGIQGNDYWTIQDNVIKVFAHVEELPDFPQKGLVGIEIFNHNIGVLPRLPEGLIWATIKCSKITELPALPDSLKNLNCSGSRALEKLPALPTTLRSLACNFCSSLSELPPLPESLQILECRSCVSLYELPPLPTKLQHLNVLGTDLKKFRLPEMTFCDGCDGKLTF
jgi:hypothetical protein